MANSARRPTRYRGRALLSALVATLGLIFGLAAPAHAGPSASTIQDQIDKEFRALEPTIESYDLVHQKLQVQQKSAAALEAKIEPLQLQVQVQLAAVGRIAAKVYMAGPSGTFTTLLNAGDSTNALNMLGAVEQLASTQREAVAGAVALQKKYEALAKPVDALVASLQVQQTALNKQKAQIQSKINALNTQQRQAGIRQEGSLQPAPCPYVYTGDAGSRAARFACRQIGKSYIFDTAGPNHFDCSGLTMAAWSTVGVTLPHNAYAQAHQITPISASQLRPGDLVFYYRPIDHVTIYVGGGWVVSAPQTGEDVQMKRYNATTPVAYGRP